MGTHSHTHTRKKQASKEQEREFYFHLSPTYKEVELLSAFVPSISQSI